MKADLDMSPRGASDPHAPSWGAVEKRPGSFREATDTGNSNRVLGLFRDLAKGVK